MHGLDPACRRQSSGFSLDPERAAHPRGSTSQAGPALNTCQSRQTLPTESAQLLGARSVPSMLLYLAGWPAPLCAQSALFLHVAGTELNAAAKLLEEARLQASPLVTSR